MRLFITGGTGLVGRRLVADRLERGDEVVVLSRDASRATSVLDVGDVDSVEIVEGDAAEAGSWQDRIDGCHAVLHLAGAGVADRRWTEDYKKLIVSSRIEGTRCVVEAIDRARDRPHVLVNASAVGWYGETGDRETDETAPAARGDFLADLVVRWEDEAGKASASGARVVMIRTGSVLDPRGGMLGQIIRPFRLGLGGPIGHGTQYLSWIHWSDLIGIIDLALRNRSASGPINATSPSPVTNHAFSHALASVLHRPCLLPVPPIALHVMLGELARYATMSQRVIPAAALRYGYEFEHPDIEPALKSLLAP